MSLKIQEFRSQLELDGARPSQFHCELTFPTLAGGVQQKFTYSARASQLPGDSVSAIPVFYQGRELKFAGTRTFPEWTVTVVNDEDFIVRNAFEQWMSGMNSHAGNLRAPAFIKGDGGYQQDGWIRQLGKRGDVIKSYKIIGAFPVDLSPIDVDWQAGDAIEEYTVTLAYQWWETADTTDTVGNTAALSPLLPRID